MFIHHYPTHKIIQWRDQSMTNGSALHVHLSNGLTLIELMIALLIISLLLAVAVPTYQRHIIKNHREYAKAALSDVGAQIARLRTRSANANLPNIINPQTLLATPLLRYQLQLSPNPIANAPIYWLTAIPVDPAQQGDGGLTLGSDGQGCWHQGNDQPAGYACGVGSKVW